MRTVSKFPTLAQKTNQTVEKTKIGVDKDSFRGNMY